MTDKNGNELKKGDILQGERESSVQCIVVEAQSDKVILEDEEKIGNPSILDQEQLNKSLWIKGTKKPPVPLTMLNR